MRLTSWISSVLIQSHRVRTVVGQRRPNWHKPIAQTEALEPRALLAFDFGDLPETPVGGLPNGYATTLANNGPRHDISLTQNTLFLGAGVDGEADASPSITVNSDDAPVNGVDDEDGIVDPLHNLVFTAGMNPVLNVRVTNTTGRDATLTGWIDLDRNGRLDSYSLSDRSQVTIPTGTVRQVVKLPFTEVPGVTDGGTTVVRLRLSTDPGPPQSAYGPASDGEVEDYIAQIDQRSLGTVNTEQALKTGHELNGGPTLGTLDGFGSAILPIGDLDRDGVADIVVGAIHDSTGAAEAGAVHVLFLNAGGSVKRSVKLASGLNGIPTLSAQDFFGSALTSLGDLDSDGVTDIAVGAAGDDADGLDRGAVFVLRLNADGTVKSSVKIAHQTNGGGDLSDGGLFGSSLATVGDLDGDGITELAVGTPTNGAIAQNSGSVVLLRMNANGSVKGRSTMASGVGGLSTLPAAAQFGRSLAGLGDINGDGVSDLVVGAPGGAADGHGSVFVLTMKADGTVLSQKSLQSGLNGVPTFATGVVGDALGAIGDLDGNGVQDIAVRVASSSGDFADRAAIQVWMLNSDGTVRSNVTLKNRDIGDTSLIANDSFGGAIASIRDLNGDAVPELLVAGRNPLNGAAEPNGQGAVYMLPLSPVLFDFGDIPFGSTSSYGGNISRADLFKTSYRNDGARHVPVGPRLGARRDAERDAPQSSYFQLGDDFEAEDDEDGVRVGTLHRGQRGATATVNVQNAPQGAFLDAWIDLDRNGAFDNPNEQIAVSTPVVNGDNTLTFDVPTSWISSYFDQFDVKARFRVSSTGWLGVGGAAADGEVEDVRVLTSDVPAKAGGFDDPIFLQDRPSVFEGAFPTDFDGDSDLDFVSYFGGITQLTWFENDGTPFDGDWTARLIAGDLIGANNGATADLDHDGDQDVVVSEYTGLYWFENDGTPADGAWSKHVIQNGSYASISLSDIDADGDLDVLKTSIQDGFVTWFENDGTSTPTNWESHNIALPASGVFEVKWGDLDGDHDCDLIVVNIWADEVFWFENDGTPRDGGWSRHVIATNQDGAGQVVVADFDNDSDLDVATSIEHAFGLRWFANDGTPRDGGWISHDITTEPDDYSDLGASDVDQDGDIDLIAASFYGDHGAVWFENDGTPDIGEWQALSLVRPSRDESFAIGDLDGDGADDIVAAGFYLPLRVIKNVWVDVAPRVVSIRRAANESNPGLVDAATFNVTVSTALTGLDPTDFIVVGPEHATVAVRKLSDLEYAVTVSGPYYRAHTGIVGLNVSSRRDARDSSLRNVLLAEPATDETYSLTAQTVSVAFTNISPNPRTTPVGVIGLAFSVPVTGVDISDFTLTRNRVDVSLNGLTVNGADSDYTIDLSSVTAEPGDYVFKLNAGRAGIQDISGRPLESLVRTSWKNALPSVSLSVDRTSVDEGMSVVVTASLSHASHRDVRVDLSIGGTATSSNEFILSSRSMLIRAGQVNASVYLTVLRDSDDELNETVQFAITSLLNAMPGLAAAASVEIVDDDLPVIDVRNDGSQILITSARDYPADVRVRFNSMLDSLIVSSFTEDVEVYQSAIPSPNSVVLIKAILGRWNDRFDATGLPFPISVDAGAGNDTVLAASVGGTIVGGDGNDSLVGANLVESLYGGPGDDTLIGNGDNDVLQGDDGVDFLSGGAGIDRLDGGSSLTAIVDDFAGSVTLTNSGYQTQRGEVVVLQGLSSATLTGSSGPDSFNSTGLTSGAVWVTGAGGNDTLQGGLLGETLLGGDGDDIVAGGGGRDSLLGEAGNDVLRGNGGTDTLNGGPGTDRLDAGTEANVLVISGIVGNLTISTVPGSLTTNVVGGGIGADTYIGRFTVAELSGDDGPNLIDASNFGGSVTLLGNSGADVLVGSTFNDLLDGGAGNDSLNGNTGDDALLGAAGNDRLNGGNGNDILTGGRGNDVLNGDSGSNTLREQENSNITVASFQLTTASGVDSFANMQLLELRGGGSANLIDARGAPVPVLLVGDAGADTLLGGPFNDTLMGGVGDDVLSGGLGVDRLVGQDGNDLQYEVADANFVVNADQVVRDGFESDSSVSIEGIVLVGGAGANLLNAFNATIPVTLIGAGGNDVLRGGSAKDVLIGGHRADLAAGSDDLAGYGSADTFDNDPNDRRTMNSDDLIVAAIFSLLPSWIDAI